MKIEVLFFEGCPNHRRAVELAKSVAADRVPDARLEEVEVRDPDDAERRCFVGSPTIRVDGEDIEPDARSSTDYAMSCRLYRGSSAPPRELIEAALRRAAE